MTLTSKSTPALVQLGERLQQLVEHIDEDTDEIGWQRTGSPRGRAAQTGRSSKPKWLTHSSRRWRAQTKAIQQVHRMRFPFRFCGSRARARTPWAGCAERIIPPVTGRE
ncbi:hypothetical protein DYH09_19370 [bacterium CPR1]|nr:hypothetical protein [bacterium CPR1]